MANLDALAPYLENLRKGGARIWTAANCPCCGQKSCRPNGNRLRIWPDSESDGRGSWCCRTNPLHHGDLVDLLMRLRPELTFPVAWRLVVGTEPPKPKSKPSSPGRGSWWTQLQRRRAEARQAKEDDARHLAEASIPLADLASAAARVGRLHRRTEAPARRALPPSEWRGRISEAFRIARAALLTEPAAAAYLADRGVTPKSAYAAGVFGWLPHDVWFGYAECGLSPGGYGTRWPLPAGLLVVSFQTTFCGEEVMAASVHCIDRARWGKRLSASGVAARAAVLRPADGNVPEAVLIMESAVDALLAWQASGGRALCVGVGGAWAPDADADAAISEASASGAPVVLVPDADEAGRRCANERWRRRWPQAVLVEAVGGKDLSDAERNARAGVPGALRAFEWMDEVRERLKGTPAVAPNAPAPFG